MLRLDGTVKLKPLRASACKPTGNKQDSYIDCTDPGEFVGTAAGAKRNFGASYSWFWHTRGKTVTETGNLGINLGNGFIYFRLTGALRTIGKATTARGVARTTGTLRFFKGTRAYKRRTASGRYTFDIVRNRTTYTKLEIHIHAVVR
jgi:hypothetical protein